MKKHPRLRFLLLVLLLQGAVLVCLQSVRSLLKYHSVISLPSKQQLHQTTVITSAPVTVITQVPIPVIRQTPPIDVLAQFKFEDAASIGRWEEKVFKGKTSYEALKDAAGQPYLHSTSQASSSGLYMKVNLKIDPQLCLSWKWRARRFPQKKDPQKLADRRQDDFAARLYVIFPGSNFFNSNVIEYIWDKHLPVGTSESSPFSDRVKLVVVRSGPASPDSWSEEERNIYEDYVQFFGKKPDRVLGAIGLMSDSDNTGTESEADFGDISLKLKKNEEGGSHGEN